MDTEQIWRAISSDSMSKEYGFLGVFSPDTLPIRACITEPCTLVCNTQDSKLPGQHWVAMHKDDAGHGWYFDSYGAPPKLPEFLALMDSCEIWDYNTKQLQSIGSTTCGQYCIFFITHCSRGYSFDAMIELLDHEDDLFVNDAMVNSFVVENFNLDSLKPTDTQFLVRQIGQIF